MERRYEIRLDPMLAQAEVTPELLHGLMDRLESFVEAFARSLDQPEQRLHARGRRRGVHAQHQQQFH